MKKIRRHVPGKRKKQRKELMKRLENQTTTLMQHPKECCVCKAPFERNKETVKAWQVVVREEEVRLTCPRCWGLVQEALEKKDV
tara:strand:+ start:121 stop:372 length:252 start_codon:yes stop_codon:yes gene_type:complete